MSDNSDDVQCFIDAAGDRYLPCPLLVPASLVWGELLFAWHLRVVFEFEQDVSAIE
ncbi:MAG: hypothetical protein AAFX40_15050 [Cyanobacteria bacterium J06639_1]